MSFGTMGLASRWRGVGAEHRMIVRGLITVGTFALVGKFAGAAKEMAVAWRYGVGPEVDAYLFVFNLISLPASIWFSVLAAVLIPLDARLQGGDQESSKFRAELIGMTALLGLTLMLLARVSLPYLLHSSRLGLPPRTAAIAMAFVPTLSWLLPIGLLIGVYSTWIMNSGSHVNTLLEGLPALGILAAVLVFGGVEALMWGTLAGTVAQFASVAVLTRKPGVPLIPRLGLSSSAWVPFWQGFGVMMAGQAIMSITTVVDQFYAAGLGEGAISALGYATRILALIMGIVATAISRATLPVFSRAHTEGSTDVRRLALRWAKLVGIGGLVVAVVAWLAAPFAIRLLFERGTFTAADTRIVSRLFQLGLFQLPLYFASLALVSFHSTSGRYGVLLASGVVALAAKLLANSILVPVMGVGGLMVALAFVYASNIVLFLAVMDR